MTLAGAADWVWHAQGASAAIARAALSPLSAVFGVVVASRNRRFDKGDGVLPVALPALSIGNLTVGGTGKTPLAAWCVTQLRERAARPALVLRGYGDDEWRVHGLLNPGVNVIADADRVRGIATAARDGADCVVLDDAFQHRRAHRVADIALISADAWTGAVQLLPGGSWREPLTSLRRASAVVITIKGTRGESQLQSVRDAIRSAAPDTPLSVVSIAAGGLREVPSGEPLSGLGGPEQALGHLNGQAVTLISAIAAPAAFEATIAAKGAHVVARRYPDHHAFTPQDIEDILRDAAPSQRFLCTLKDAVKLAPLWPRAAPPLWYVSQTIEVRLGLDVLHGALERVLAARLLPRAASRPNAG
jgi:tetraacyldisaccharide 4'-kinase